MKILFVHGSPDREGNSAKLMHACLSGIHETGGAEAESINVYDYTVEPIWSDYFGDVMAKTTDKVNDDMPALKNKLRAANIIVLATPIHWYQVSGKMKIFLDRWTDLVNPDWSTELNGKGLALLSTHSGINLMNSSNLLELAMMGTAQFMGMTWLGGVGGRAQMPWGWDDEPSLAQGKLFGTKLAKGMNLIGQPVIQAG